MLTMNEVTTIKVLRSKGVSIRAIARQLKISRNTVRKYLKTDEPPAYHIKNWPENNLNIIGSTKSKWGKYQDKILDMYYNKRFIGSRIFNELKKEGAEGSLTGFYMLLRKIKEQDVAKKVRARFETGPGKQCQFDWTEYVVKIGGELRKVYVFNIILCFSRYKYLIGSYNKNQCSVFEAIERAFQEFGGVPEEILTDNGMQMVSNCSPKNFEYNQQYINFLNYYGVTPRVCKIRHCWTKGKVENPFQYLEEHFIKGHEFSSLDDFNFRLREFTDKWNKQQHEGINDIPYQRYIAEKEYLKPLPTSQYIGREMIWTKVSSDCLISYGGNKYSVPYIYAFNQVWVKDEFGNKLKIYSQKCDLLAEYQIPAGKGNILIKPQHYAGLIKTTVNNPGYLQAKFIEYFPDIKNYLENVSAQKRTHWKWHIAKILSLAEIYKIDDIREALKSSIKHNVYSYNYVLAYMRQNFDINYQEYTKSINIPNNNQLGLDDIKRPLQEYEEVISHGEI